MGTEVGCFVVNIPRRAEGSLGKKGKKRAGLALMYETFRKTGKGLVSSFTAG